jgi:hypothetical protein
MQNILRRQIAIVDQDKVIRYEGLVPWHENRSCSL